MESIQHKLDRVRPPRVQITYDVEIGDAIQMMELPFVVGVIADISGHPEEPLPPIKKRKFVEIDRDNINHILESVHPRITAAVENKLIGDGSTMQVELRFQSMDDFAPLSIVKQVPALNEIYVSRSKLKDVLAKVDGNDELNQHLEKLIEDDSYRKTIAKALNSTDPTASVEVEEGKDLPPLEEIMVNGKMARTAPQRPFAFDMLKEYISHIEQQGTVSVRDPSAFVNQRIQQMDEMISTQLDEIMHDSHFQKLEGTWRGLSYLVMNTETSTHLKLRILNVTKEEVLKDLERAVEFDQSQLFKKVYEEEYGTFGGHPYSCLVADYYFTRHPQDFELLEKLSGVAAAAHAPLLTAAEPKLFDLDGWGELGHPRDLAKIFESLELIKWTSFRNSEDSRYINLFLPRVLMRLPYGNNTLPAEGINYEENVSGADTSKFCWSNAAYVMAERITNAFAHYGWTAAIRGVEGGGIVEGLPAYTFRTTDGDIALKCPTEVSITDRREKELSDLGFISLIHCKGTDYAAFFGNQSTHKPKVYDKDEANANANLSARLSYLLVASRFAHYIKAIMRDKIGSFMTKDNVAFYLNRWISNYVLLNDDAPQFIKAKYPLREARVDVYDDPSNPGKYRAVVYLRPHFQLEELTVSIRLVAKLPPPAG